MGLWVLLGLPAAGWAAPVDLNMAKAPLEVGLTPAPNVLIVADDSGSMNWEIVVSQDAHLKEHSLDGAFLGNTFFGYAYVFGHGWPHKSNDSFGNSFPASDFSGRVAPTQKAISDMGNNYEYRTAMSGIWRLRNPDFNLIYYNPKVRYDPWPGYGNSPPSAARLDPTKTATINLTTNRTLGVTIPRSGRQGHYYAEISTYLPFYYTWAPSSNNDTRVDAGECGRLVEIKANAVYKSCTGGTLGGQIFPMAKDPKRTDCASATTCTAAEELQNFANWFTYYRRREFISKAALAKVVPNLPDVRLGYTTINGASYSSGNRPLYPISSTNNVTQLRDHIYKTVASGGTNLLRSLDEAGKYFACQSGHIMGTNSCPAVNNSVWACQQNFTILMTDGFWDIDAQLWAPPSWFNSNDVVVATAAPFADNDSDNSSPFAGGIFGDNNRSGSASNQWLTLADVAMYYYKTDLDTNAPNKVLPTPLEKTRIADTTYFTRNPTMHQHMNTFTIGFGVFNDPQNSIGSFDSNGQWLPPAMTDTVNWPRLQRDQADTNKLEDLKHTAFNGRGMFYNATNIDGLVSNLEDIFKSIRSGVGTVAAASFNSQQLAEGSVAYTASYDFSAGSGDVVAYGIDKDTGAISTATSNVKWRAAARLGQKITAGCNSPADTRTMLSYSRNGANSTGVALGPVTGALSANQVTWLRGRNNHETATGCANSANLRDRERPKGLIGDIVHSRPLFVGKPSFSDRDIATYPSGTNAYSKYQSDATVRARQDMVVVGANDGLLHVFNAANGDEIVAYAPRRLIDGGAGNSRTADLTASTYNHQYYVDLSPAVNDVFIKPSAAGDRRWSTVVIGGYRAGGRGYFALDLTDPTAFSTETNGAKRVLWEFSDLDNNGLGLTFSPPLMAMTNEPHSNTTHGHKWRAIFGNGYNSADGTPRLFLLDMEAGYDGWQSSDYKVITAGSAPATGTPKNGLGVPRGVDIDANGTLDYAYAGDLQGNLYRFDLTSKTGSFTATRIFTAESSNGTRQPITTQPLVVRHPQEPGKLIVIFTTGSWMTQTDSASTAIQSVYAVTDDMAASAATTAYKRNLLIPRRIKTVEVDGGTYRVLEGEELVWSATVKGWYMDFDARAAGVSPSDSNYARQPVVNPGERAVRNMVMRNGYIFVNTVFPTGSDSCSASSGGATMGFNPITGLLDRPMFDFNGNGEFDIDGNKDPIAGLVSNGSLSDSAMIGNHLVFQEVSANGVITPKSILTNTTDAKLKGRLSWRQLR